MQNSDNLEKSLLNHISKRKATEISTLILEKDRIERENKIFHSKNILLEKNLKRVRSHRNAIFQDWNKKKEKIAELNSEIENLRERCNLLEKLAITQKNYNPVSYQPDSKIVTELIRDAIKGEGPHIIKEILCPSDIEHNSPIRRIQENGSRVRRIQENSSRVRRIQENNSSFVNQEKTPIRVLYTNHYLMTHFKRNGVLEDRSFFGVEKRDIKIDGRIDFHSYRKGVEFKLNRDFRKKILERIKYNSKRNIIVNLYKNYIDFVGYDLKFKVEFVKIGFCSDEIFRLVKRL